MLRFWYLLALAASSSATNFNWEKVQLNRNETVGYPDIDFGNTSGLNSTYTGPECKVGPGDAEWPTIEEWAKLNKTLAGALLRPSAPGAVCYKAEVAFNSATCSLITSGNRTRYTVEHPTGIYTEWAAGNTCTAAKNPEPRKCTQGAFPVYVVNATTVKHIQIAVNFARNRNLRLIIKNTGHDFVGRSSGAGSLSIWTHHLKSFEYLSEFTSGPYTGRAARASAGVEMYEVFNYMGQYNMTMVLPGGDTVGIFGGFIAGGGHHFLASLYGLGADQVLEFNVVTADGKYRTVTPYQNGDLYYAMLGGGGGTYAILTSVIMKAYPKTPVTDVSLDFYYRKTPVNNTNLVIVNDLEKFWSGVYLYQHFSPNVLEAGGTLYSYVYPDTPTEQGLQLSAIIKLPLHTASQAVEILKPLYDSLNALGISVTPRPVPNQESNTTIPLTGAYTPPRQGGFFASRLIPRSNWDNTTIFNLTFSAVIRSPVEAGLTFHGVDHYSPTSLSGEEGYPASLNSITPFWRNSYLHAAILDRDFLGFETGTPEQYWKLRERMDKVMGIVRAVTPGGGAYVNEADVLEPEWQRTFYGRGYEKLARIKKARDPWGLFWAVQMPGSEEWEVRSREGKGLPTQNGRLCRTGWEEKEVVQEVEGGR